MLALVMIAGRFYGPKNVMAQYYGTNNDTPVVVVDKKIRLSSKNILQDNIGKDEFVFVEGDQIEFTIDVENRGKETLYDLKLNDILPLYLKLQYYFGDYANNTLKTNISILKSGESRHFYVIAIVKDVPVTNYMSEIKQINKACVENSVVSDCDSASYFVGSKTMPVTGNESLIFNSIMAVLGMTGAMGLRKYIRGY